MVVFRQKSVIVAGCPDVFAVYVVQGARTFHGPIQCLTGRWLHCLAPTMLISRVGQTCIKMQRKFDSFS